MIKLYNRVKDKDEEFKPLKKGVLTMYNCGPTVYAFAHIGNLRSYVFADTVRRVFEYDGYDVKQVINITDVGHLVSDNDNGEDKIEYAVKKEKKSAEEIISFYTDRFLSDIKALNVNTEGVLFPRATENIKEQIKLIQTLEEKGFAYVIEDGVYFDTAKIINYGDFAKLDIEGLKEGARVEANYDKRNLTDFALWKFVKAGEKREQEWESPWGLGFPGWHLECSAMSMKYLGETLDLHTGGIDHIPIHHTNEIAQSESATGKPFVNYWLHHEHVMIDGGKMSKSLGNVTLLSNIIEKGFNPLSYRYLLLTAHYRTLVNFTWESLKASDTALLKLYDHYVQLENKEGEIDKKYKKEFQNHINNDLDTPQAIATLWNLIKDNNIDDGAKKATIDDFDKVLGFGFREVQKERQNKDLTKADIPTNILDLSNEREEARNNKEWDKSDEIRDKVKGLGYLIEDTPQGPHIEKI